MQGLGGGFAVEPEVADRIAYQLIEVGGLQAIEALVDLRRAVGAPVGERAGRAAARWLEQALAAPGADDGLLALGSALRDELAGPAAAGTLAEHASAARTALIAGDLPAAVGAARAAVDELAAVVEWLERASDDDPIERRHAVRVLRELDRDVLVDGAIGDVLALGGDPSGAGRDLATLCDRAERRLLALEAAPETRSPVPHHTLRLARLRALIRLLDADRPGDDDATRRGHRVGAVRTLLARAPRDSSALRRAVWAGLARAWDALLRDEQAELADLLIGLDHVRRPRRRLRDRPRGDDGARRRRRARGLRRRRRARWPRRSIPPTAARWPRPWRRSAGWPRRCRSRPRRAPRRCAPRSATPSTRWSPIAGAGSQAGISTDALDELEAAIVALAQLGVGARRRLGLRAVTARGLTSDVAIRAVARALERQGGGRRRDRHRDRGGPRRADAGGRRRGRARAGPGRPPAARGRRHRRGPAAGRPGPAAVAAPRRASSAASTSCGPSARAPAARSSSPCAQRGPPPQRRGAGRAQGARVRRRRGPQRCRSASSRRLFREEAGALLALPGHANIARFVTFDAGARPKPILVMELVEGPSLERPSRSATSTRRPRSP